MIRDTKNKNTDTPERTKKIMAQRKTREELGVKPGDTIVISGTVAYARLLNKISGAELEKDIKERQSRNQIPINDPYYSVTLEDVEISRGANTPLAIFTGQSVYTRKSGKKAISLTSKSAFPVTFFHETGNGQAVQITPDAEFAVGQKISILIKAFMPKSFNRMSSSPQSVLIPEGEIQYYTASGAAADLNGFGLTAAKELDAASTPELPKVEATPVETPIAQTAPADPFASMPAAPADPFAQATTANENPFAND